MYKVVLNKNGRYTSLCGELEYGEKHYTAPEFGKLFVFKEYTPAEGFLRRIRDDYPNAELWEVEAMGKVEQLQWEPCVITRDFWFPLECFESREFRPCPRGTVLVSCVKLLAKVEIWEGDDAED